MDQMIAGDTYHGHLLKKSARSSSDLIGYGRGRDSMGGSRYIRYFSLCTMPARFFLIKYSMYLLKAGTLSWLAALNLPASTQSSRLHPSFKSARCDTFSNIYNSNGYLWMRVKSTSTRNCLLRVKKPHQSDYTSFSANYFIMSKMSLLSCTDARFIMGLLSQWCGCCCCCWLCWRNGLIVLLMPEDMGFIILAVLFWRFIWQRSWFLTLGHCLVIFSESISKVTSAFLSPKQRQRFCLTLSLARRACASVSNSINTQLLQTFGPGSSLGFIQTLRMNPNLLNPSRMYCSVLKGLSLRIDAQITGTRSSTFSQLIELDTTFHLLT